MSTEPVAAKPEIKKMEMRTQGRSSDTVYALGFIGACVYFIGRATTTEERVKGFFKSMVWPAILVHDLLKSLNKE